MLKKRIETLATRQELKQIIPHFIDICTTATNRATHYDTKQEQQQAINTVHDALFNIDRGLYSIITLLPGTMDYTKQLAIYKLLTNHRNINNALTTASQEFKILQFLSTSLETPRMFKTFINLRLNKINNSRTKRLCLSVILNAENTELWSTKYRIKIKKILEHCWGKRNTSIIKSILHKFLIANATNDNTIVYPFSNKEIEILHQNIFKYTHSNNQNPNLYQCLAFILGHENNLKLPLLNAYVTAKQNIEQGKSLAYETLQGIRSTYHPTFPANEILNLTMATATAKQQKNFQRKAQQENVALEFNPYKYNAIELYIYTFENGMTDDIKQALITKAKKAAQSFLLKYNNIGILVDNSFSASGHYTQKLRPIAISLAIRDMLCHIAPEKHITYNTPDLAGFLAKPANSTRLADGLIYLLKQNPDAIFIISDGYENAPAGRTAEVVYLARKIGINIPIFQLSPVTGAESFGIRNLSEDITAIPVSNPATIGFSMLKPMFEQDLKQALWSIVRLVNKNVKLLSEGE